ncbi:MAG TPA: alpha/beta hydrolase [Woeseiaceae bacterium]|nr:alpha/beta hydrolase [Woeseiaceae bacterium]
MKSRMVTGGGGAQLHVVDAGNAAKRPILFIHGLSQCWLAWRRQLESALAEDFRLVAMDLRGHGLSDKPRDAYGDSKLWADDVNAVIQQLELEQPVLCGWSYGPLVVLDYIRHYTDAAIGGANFIGGVTKMGSEEAMSVLTPEFLALVPGFFSTDVEQSVRATNSLLRLCFASEIAGDDRYLMLGYNVSVPPHVRQGLLSRGIDNDDLLPKIQKPVLLTHGAHDAVVKLSVNDEQMSRIPKAVVRVVDKAGHACFWDEAEAYNCTLREFVEGSCRP